MIMDRSSTISQGICHRCQKPALTVDRDGVPWCPRHARITQVAQVSVRSVVVASPPVPHLR